MGRGAGGRKNVWSKEPGLGTKPDTAKETELQ